MSYQQRDAHLPPPSGVMRPLHRAIFATRMLPGRSAA